MVDPLDAGHPEQPWAVHVGVALEDSGTLGLGARRFAMNLRSRLPVQAVRAA